MPALNWAETTPDAPALRHHGGVCSYRSCAAALLPGAAARGLRVCFGCGLTEALGHTELAVILLRGRPGDV